MTGEALARLATALSDRYGVERELGAGGMATVYLAHDLKHGRLVALKVLHPELGALLGAERFLAEIKTTAVLQHPNILQLFDSGVADGLLYYVMPYVAGEALRHRLARQRQLPVEEVLQVARGAAAALDYAHRHGVIHRDIKPENILLQDGQPLVADFGIALAVRAAGGVRLTETGLSLGTPQYMSPEQATGERELDGRTDVYSLGAVTYEMLTGEPPYSGVTSQAIIAKLLTEDPRPVSILRRSVPPHVEIAIHRALEKLPADRFGTAAQFGEALTRPTAEAFISGGPRTGTWSGRPSRRSRILLVTAGLGAGVLLLGLGWLMGSRRAMGPISQPASRLTLYTPGVNIVSSGLQRVIDISQDGETIVFAASTEEAEDLRLRRLDGGAIVRIEDSDLSRQPRLSPDGRFVYSPHGSGTMQRKPLAGGGWSPLVGTDPTPYFTFGSDGTIWWSPPARNGIHRILPNARDELVFPPDSLGLGLAIQQILPGDRTALVLDDANATSVATAALLDLQSGVTRPLLEGQVVEVRYTAGHLIFVRADNTMQAVAFDPATGRTSGEMVLLANDVALTGAGTAQFAVAPNGTVVYVPSFPGELVTVSRSGMVTTVVAMRRQYHNPRFSPDGRRIAFDYVGEEGRDVWIFDRVQQQLTRATFDNDGHDPAWAPDGRSLYYTSLRRGHTGVYRILPGTNRVDSIHVSAHLAYTGTPLPDGSLVTMANDVRAGTAGDIVRIRPGQSELEPIQVSAFNEAWAAPSPDGKWLALVSDQTGAPEVFVRTLEGTETWTQVSVGGGTEPMWSRNGRELFYRRTTGGRAWLVAAELRLNAGVEVIRRTDLFDVSDYDSAQPHANYDVTADGQTFVMIRRSPASYIVVIQNLPELVRRLQSGTPP